jgi:hypothetical protein
MLSYVWRHVCHKSVCQTKNVITKRDEVIIYSTDLCFHDNWELWKYEVKSWCQWASDRKVRALTRSQSSPDGITSWITVKRFFPVDARFCMSSQLSWTRWSQKLEISQLPCSRHQIVTMVPQGCQRRAPFPGVLFSINFCVCPPFIEKSPIVIFPACICSTVRLVFGVMICEVITFHLHCDLV